MRPIGMLIYAAAIGAIIAAGLVIRPLIAQADTLKQGDIAPMISTKMIVGEQIAPFSLAEYRGRKVILYFYPKDDTPGCTKEACAFRDGYARFQQAGLMLVGCSVDTADSHRSFIKKYNIPFPLLLDPDKKIATAYGAANGIPILGLDKRITYVVGEDGRIAKVYPNVDPSAHASQILSDLGANTAAPAPTAAAAPTSAQDEN